jgi:hypothetical protein
MIRRKKYYLNVCLILMTLFFGQQGSAQTLNVNNQNGSNSAYALQDVRRLTFENTNLVVMLFDGNSYSFPLATLINYRYDSGLANVEELLNNARDWQLEIYPNPTASELTVEFSLLQEEEINYSISDLSGKVLLSNHLGMQATGDHSYKLSLHDLPTGNYIFRINRKESSLIKAINKI